MKDALWIVVGPLTVDTVVRADKSVTKIGGVVTYASLTLKRLGISTCVVTTLGKNEAGLTRLFDEQGIDIIHQIGANTTRFINRIDGDTRQQEMPLRADPIAVWQMEEIENEVGGYYLGPLHPDDISNDVLDHLDKIGAVVVVDIQGYVRKVEDGDVVIAAMSQKLPKVLTMAHCVKATEWELELICVELGMEPHDLMNRFKLSELVITAGIAGGWVMESSGNKVVYRVTPARQIVDTTGAGDVFFAAYIAFRHNMGCDVREASHNAATWAARHVEGRLIDENLLRITRYLSENPL